MPCAVNSEDEPAGEWGPPSTPVGEEGAGGRTSCKKVHGSKWSTVCAVAGACRCQQVHAVRSCEVGA